MTRMGLGLVTLFIFAWVPGCASRETFDGPIVDVDLDVCSPEGEFTLQSTNPYFPMDVGKQWVLEGGDERVQVTVLDETEVVVGLSPVNGSGLRGYAVFTYDTIIFGEDQTVVDVYLFEGLPTQRDATMAATPTP